MRSKAAVREIEEDVAMGMPSRFAESGYLFTLLALTCFLFLVAEPTSLFVAVIFLLLFLAFSLFKASSFSVLLLGFFTPFAAVFGPGTLLLVALGFICLEPAARRLKFYNWAWPLLSLMFIWVLFDIWALSLMLRDSWVAVSNDPLLGYEDLLLWLRSSAPNGFLSVSLFLTIVVFFSLVGFLTGHAERENFCSALVLGLIPAGILSVIQIAGFIPDFFSNQNDFFRSIGRFSGTFSDPNAFGVFIVLVLPLLVYEALKRQGLARFFLYSFAFFWLVLGVYSGSRTFFLGLFCYGLIYVLRSGRLLIASLIFGVGAIALIGFFPEFLLNFAPYFPVGVQRMVETVSASSFEQAFFSRLVFFQLNLLVWLDNPFFGIGFNQFRLMVPEYSSLYSLGLGVWADNPNNFYLGALSELGVIGIFSLLLCISYLGWQRESPSIRLFQAAVVCFAALLLVGPHLHFIEVSILAALLLSYAVRTRQKSWLPFSRVACSFVAVAAFVLVGNVSLSGITYGFYPMEQDEAGFFRWTGIRAARTIPCKEGQTVGLLLSAGNPDMNENPLITSVQISSPGADVLRSELLLNLSNPAQKLKFECRRSKYGFFSPEMGHARVSIHNSRAWVPKKFGMGEDPRLLGVRMYYVAEDG